MATIDTCEYQSSAQHARLGSLGPDDIFLDPLNGRITTRRRGMECIGTDFDTIEDLEVVTIPHVSGVVWDAPVGTYVIHRGGVPVCGCVLWYHHRLTEESLKVLLMFNPNGQPSAITDSMRLIPKLFPLPMVDGIFLARDARGIPLIDWIGMGRVTAGWNEAWSALDRTEWTRTVLPRIEEIVASQRIPTANPTRTG